MHGNAKRYLTHFFLLAVAGCVAPKPRPPVPYQSEPWTFAKVSGVKLTTEHYEIYTTLRDEVLRAALPDFVEAAYASYTALVPPARTPPARMKVYLFAARDQWEAFTRWFTGPRAKVFLQVRNGGYSERGVSVIEYVRHEITFPLFAHEGFHQYLYHCVNTEVPAWLNEGLAVVCEGQRWGSLRLERFDPWYNPTRRNELAEALASDHLYPLPRLLRTDAGRIIGGTNRAVGTYYAQLWALMLFLREGADGRYAADFQRLLKTLGEGNLESYARAAHIWSQHAAPNFGEDLFRSFISEDLDAVQREYQAFMRQRFFGKS